MGMWNQNISQSAGVINFTVDYQHAFLCISQKGIHVQCFDSQGVWGLEVMLNTGGIEMSSGTCVNSNVCVKSDFHGSSFPISPLISRLVCLYNTGVVIT